MTEIKPFKAVFYNQETIKDFSKVICPPYDVISGAQQQYYHEISPYNIIHMLLGKDILGEDKYKRAAHYFDVWQKERILIQDDAPCIYFYNHQYTLRGEKKTRLGFMALLRLAAEQSRVFAHEHTRIEPKEDRLKLLKQVKVNLSPIFVLFADRKRIIQRINQQCILGKKPFIETVDDEKNTHKVWRLDSPEILDKLQRQMQGENIFIADGHHRYEVACTYRQLMFDKMGSVTGQEGFNYILAYFTNMDSRGLTVLAIHRLVKLPSGFQTDAFMNRLKDYFDIETIKDKTRFFYLMEKGAQAEHMLGFYRDRTYVLLRLKNIKILDKIIVDKPPKVRSLDVSVLNHIILNGILGFDLEDKQNINFSPNAEELIEKVDSDNSYVSFFLNPAKLTQIISVALSGEKMPSKSTYFYPKVLSGLVINKH